jgi:hypothetical protein
MHNVIPMHEDPICVLIDNSKETHVDIFGFEPIKDRVTKYVQINNLNGANIKMIVIQNENERVNYCQGMFTINNQ